MSISSAILPTSYAVTTSAPDASMISHEPAKLAIKRFQAIRNAAASSVIEAMQWNTPELKGAFRQEFKQAPEQWVCLENMGTNDVLGFAWIQPTDIGCSVHWMGVTQRENGDAAYIQLFHALMDYIKIECAQSHISVTFNHFHPRETPLHYLVENNVIAMGYRHSLRWIDRKSILTLYPHDQMWESVAKVDLSSVRLLTPTAPEAQKTSGKRSRTEWTVEIGSDESAYELWKDWDTRYKVQFEWNDTCVGLLRHYGDLKLEQRSLQVKCDFIEVNGRVLMLVQPQGRFVAYPHLESHVNEWLGTKRFNAITNTINFQNNLIWINSGEAQTRTDTFPYGARSAVIVGDDYQRDRFIESAFTESGIPCTKMAQTDVKEYTAPVGESKEMYAHLQSRTINGIAVNFFCTSGTYEDRETLKVRVRAWFPESEKFISKEELPSLLPLIAGE